MVSYNKLWKLLINKNMSKHELLKLTGISSSSLAKLKKAPILLLTSSAKFVKP